MKIRVLVVLGVIVGVCLAVTWTGSSGDDTAEIAVGGVTGSHGAESSEWTSSSGYAVARAYGFHCDGTTCEGSDDPPAVDNILTIALVREETETGPLVVRAQSALLHKLSGLDSKDHDCPQGPPMWSGSGSIKLSEPGAGSPSSGFVGSLEDTFTHLSPSTSYRKSWSDQPVPSGTNGTSYEEQIGDQVEWNWDYDPLDPSSSSFAVSAKVTTDFIGSAVEIKDVHCWLQADAMLIVEVSSP